MRLINCYGKQTHEKTQLVTRTITTRVISFMFRASKVNAYNYFFFTKIKSWNDLQPIITYFCASMWFVSVQKWTQSSHWYSDTSILQMLAYDF